MAVVREKEGRMARGLCDMLGKTVTVDGCFVGYVNHLCIEQYEHGGAVIMQIKVLMTNDTLDNVREYEYIQSVMGGEDTTNEASKDNL